MLPDFLVGKAKVDTSVISPGFDNWPHGAHLLFNRALMGLDLCFGK